MGDEKYIDTGMTFRAKKKNKKHKHKTKKTKKGKYKLYIDEYEWDGHAHAHAECQTPVNSQYTNPNGMSCRHNPPSIVSISRSTNQLSLQHQQLNRLHHPIS